ncbi:GDP-mannose 4,6-dehydratase [Cohnella thailandensis]|uniref:GDP-mannose 4,6-dehydratase n=1 Tax=Cohnella thailandensis TaxID=557557 RepID=A0A841T170_9BACL|nr:GDP-mannose 4,6-dehydratase [Cohnella thailandensis]MBB6638163.1 GDP-mannose 4,6-dehydratase [Cohnella thailandensis]MBP1971912.1 UDP-glucuronate 4-epimerase [Cohnella thailandensis]
MNGKLNGPHETFLITGVVGFIGFFLTRSLLDQGCNVVGIDNLNDYYGLNLKNSRLEALSLYDRFTFLKADISDKEILLKIFKEYKPRVVVNLAAQAGVRYSIENPDAYIQSNIVGFFNILEACRHHPVEHLLYASSSSVYGSNQKVPFEEMDFVDHPVSLYAATKKSNELMAHTYSHLYKIPATGLRFFTVYGPMGRPDMAYFGFADKYFSGEPIKIFNNGDFENDLYRDFTYIDDIVEGIERLICNPPQGEVQHEVYNIGNNNPEKLMVFIETLEKAFSNKLKRKVEFNKIFEPIKPGDVPATYASTERLQQAVGFKPKTPIEVGLQKFADWYVDYYKVK